MENAWAAEQLRIIRTLMERSSLYRIELAPISLVVGLIGIATGLVGFFLNWATPLRFGLLWLLVSVFCAVIALLMMRREYRMHHESFLTPPARRIIRACLPIILLAIMFYTVLLLPQMQNPDRIWGVIAFLTAIYGCILNAAGFFLSRGIRFLGSVYLFAGIVLWVVLCMDIFLPRPVYAHLLMGVIFGLGHFVYGIYLFLTRKSS